jgi:hypothetical protein
MVQDADYLTHDPASAGFFIRDQRLSGFARPGDCAPP